MKYNNKLIQVVKAIQEATNEERKITQALIGRKTGTTYNHILLIIKLLETAGVISLVKEKRHKKIKIIDKEFFKTVIRYNNVMKNKGLMK